MTSDLLAAAAPPAGGAALGEVIGATTVGLGLTAGLLALGWAHRTGRTELLQRWADREGRRQDRPSWAALPVALSRTALLVALLGMYWDISLHIDNGRDPGPLANPAHYLILAGLFGLFGAGVLAVALPRERPGPAAVRITRDWWAPTGGLLLTATGSFALLGFPLDDVWHRLFGQDVTLWGPTHLMLIGGAGLSLVAVLVLEQEGRASLPKAVRPPSARAGRLAYLRRVFACGGLLIGLSVFQAEYDFGVPQFRLVLQPLLIAAAAGMALVVARLTLGRGGALAAVVAYLAVRGGVSLVVADVFGQSLPSVPLYLGEALVIELAALGLLRRPLLFGAVGGLLAGTVGTLTEGLWTQAAFTLPWNGDVAVEGLLLSATAGTAAGVIGALLALGLQGRLPRPRLARPLLVGALVVLAGGVADGLVTTVPAGLTATVALTDVAAASAAGPRTALATVTLSRPLDDPAWVTLTSWQGGGLVVDRLRADGTGRWVSTRPLPVSGDWKTLVRLHDGRLLAASPVYLPADAALGAPEVPALATSTRPVTVETAILQRERKADIPGWLWTTACLVVGTFALLLMLGLAWGVARLSVALAADRPVRPARPVPAGVA